MESKGCCEDLIKYSINGAGLVVHVKVWTPGALGFGVATLLVQAGVRPRSFLPDLWGDVVFSAPPLSFPRLVLSQECPPFSIFPLKSSRFLLKDSLILPPNPDPIPWSCVPTHSFWVSFFPTGLGFQCRDQIYLPTR